MRGGIGHDCWVMGGIVVWNWCDNCTISFAFDDYGMRMWMTESFT